MAILDILTDSLFGGGTDVFGSGLGGEFGDFLSDRLATPASESEQFRTGATALRDRVGAVAGAQRQRFSDRASAGGFQDSGAAITGIQDIDRQELGAFQGGLTDLLLGLEDRREQSVLGFLQGQSGEATANSNRVFEGINSLVGVGSAVASGGSRIFNAQTARRSVNEGNAFPLG